MRDYKCKICSVIFTDYRTNYRKFCSVDCANQSFRERDESFRKKHGWKISRANMGHETTEETRRKISVANKKAYANPILRAEISKRQMGKNNSSYTAMLGEKNPNWRGGVTPIANAIRKLSEYKEWRRQVFGRDDYTCRHCGERGGELQADHIKPFSQIMHENAIKTIEQAKQCDEFWNTENGRTLCKSCHLNLPTVALNQYSYGK